MPLASVVAAIEGADAPVVALHTLPDGLRGTKAVLVTLDTGADIRPLLLCLSRYPLVRLEAHNARTGGQ